jgi:hypothetical protein
LVDFDDEHWQQIEKNRPQIEVRLRVNRLARHHSKDSGLAAKQHHESAVGIAPRIRSPKCFFVLIFGVVVSDSGCTIGGSPVSRISLSPELALRFSAMGTFGMAALGLSGAEN